MNDTPNHELFGVPYKHTPVRVPRRKGEKHCCQVLSHEPNLLQSDQSDQHGQYVIFSNVDENTYDQYFIYSHDRARGYEYILDKKLALVKLTTHATEVATGQLHNIFFEKKLVDMYHTNRKLTCLGTTSDFASKDDRFRRKPDMSYMPKHLPRESKWPTIVMETGYVTSKRRLDWNTRWWLNKSEGEVKLVFVTCIQRQTMEYLLQRWELVERIPVVRYEIVLSGPGPDQSVYVSSTDEPLVLRFEDVFARLPGEGEEDIILCLEGLKMLARDVWHFEFSDSFE